MNVLVPRTSQRPSSLRAAVEMLCVFVPASGSVTANATRVVPAAMPGSQSSFCSRVPWRTRIEPAIAGETTMSSSEHPEAEISSPTALSPVMPSPTLRVSFPRTAPAILLNSSELIPGSTRCRPPGPSTNPGRAMARPAAFASGNRQWFVYPV